MRTELRRQYVKFSSISSNRGRCRSGCDLVGGESGLPSAARKLGDAWYPIGTNRNSARHVGPLRGASSGYIGIAAMPAATEGDRPGLSRDPAWPSDPGKGDNGDRRRSPATTRRSSATAGFPRSWGSRRRFQLDGATADAVITNMRASARRSGQGLIFDRSHNAENRIQGVAEQFGPSQLLDFSCWPKKSGSSLSSSATISSRGSTPTSRANALAWLGALGARTRRA